MVGADFEIVPPALIVTALRDSGYKNAAYALAELVDNAVQAGASVVEVFCKEQQGIVSQRTRRRIHEIAVIDNGHGMTPEVLRKALQFGNGTRLEDRTGIGRFGMGLPNSSMSQAKRVEVWTWTNGVKNAVYSYLDLSEIKSGHIRQVPDPVSKVVPPDYLTRSPTMSTSPTGTLVLWSQIDRCDWRTARSIINNSELLIGRIYRRFLNDGRLRIRMVTFQDGSLPKMIDEERDAVANDPTYLMERTSCEAPFSDQAMFTPYGEDHKLSHTVDGVTHTVTIRLSIAKSAARQGHNPGGQPHGKHAQSNLGVSVVRAERELELQTVWCNQYDPRERWWGVEVEFPPALDEIFGVTNNKQSARVLAEFATLTQIQIAEREGFKTEQELTADWIDNNDPRFLLLAVKNHIEKNLGAIRGMIKAQTENSGAPGPSRHIPTSAEVVGTKATEQRKKEGFIGQSDKEEAQPAAVRKEQIRQDFVERGMTEEEADRRATGIVENHLKFDFQALDLQTPEFFTVKRKGGALLIGLNINHPAYSKLISLTEQSEEDSNVEKLRSRLKRSHEGLKLLLEAWARYEDELTDGPRRIAAQDARLDWGRVAREFFRED